MADRRMRILVAGAGPTGLTAAVELWRLGFSPRIIDRDEGPTPLSKAVGVSPHSLDLLEASGVTARLLERGIRVRQVQARYHDRLLATVRIGRLPHRFNFLLCLPQSQTERTMEEVLEGFGGRVEWRTELKAVRLTGDGVEADLAVPGGDETAVYDVLFAADGPRSRVREALGIGFSGYTHKRLWSIADVEVSGWPYPAETAEAVLHDNGDLGFIIPTAPGRFRAVSNTPDALSQIPGLDGVKVLGADTFHLPIRQADRYRQGGAFLGGDAAHVHSPVGARGMNLGIEDACAFARRLTEDLLDGYEAERRPAGARWMRLSERVLAGVQASGQPAVTLRNLAIRTVGALPALQQPMMQRVAGLRE